MLWPTVALIDHGIIFGVITLVLYFAGNRHILAGSARSGIKDVARLNRWAAQRFLMLTVLASLLARISRDDMAAGILGLMFLWACVFGVIIWISVSGRKF